MKEQIAYETYRDSLKSRTRNWHELKAEAVHKDKANEIFDTWLRENKSDILPRYFMGEYDAIPQHTKDGWEAFVDHASNGAEEAWNNYADVARSNFHKDKGITLPRYETLGPDQQIAVAHAVTNVLERSLSFGR